MLHECDMCLHNRVLCVYSLQTTTVSLLICFSFVSIIVLVLKIKRFFCCFCFNFSIEISCVTVNDHIENRIIQNAGIFAFCNMLIK